MVDKPRFSALPLDDRVTMYVHRRDTGLEIFFVDDETGNIGYSGKADVQEAAQELNKKVPGCLDLLARGNDAPGVAITEEMYNIIHSSYFKTARLTGL